MEHDNVADVLASLLSHPEAEWIEYKHNNSFHEEIGQNISALSNAARLHRRDAAYIIWGIEDESRKIVGTTFRPRRQKVKSQELENWISTQHDPKIDFRIHELEFQGKPIVLFSIQPSTDRPVSFKAVEYIRVGSYTKKLRDHPEKERALWGSSQVPFERELAIRNAPTEEVLKLLDYQAYFELAHQAEPIDAIAILERFEQEKLVARFGNQRWNITNLGALLFARKLSDFGSVLIWALATAAVFPLIFPPLAKEELCNHNSFARQVYAVMNQRRSSSGVSRVGISLLHLKYEPRLMFFGHRTRFVVNTTDDHGQYAIRNNKR